jgi:hydroxymethylpyrimidine pyrophosphatase-like HAD family hydrolase
MLDLEAALLEAWPGRLSLHVIRSPRYRDWMCEIAPAGVTKWTGVVGVATRLGIEPEAICAVGDDVNDLPMIRGAGLGIAMGNATADVLSAADVVVDTHDAGGITEVADRLLAGLA